MKLNKALLIMSLCFAPLVVTSCGAMSQDQMAEKQIHEIYELAKTNGYEGTYEEWLESIKGPKGDKGDQGEVGAQGPAGQDGADGLSAYELYKKTHPEYTKTVEEWLDDLVNDRLGTKITYDVSFNTGTDQVIPSQTVEHGSKIIKPETPVFEGHTFKGWEYKGEIWSFVGHVVTEDMILNAVWDLNEYKVTINYNNQHEPETKIYHYNDILTLEDPRKDNYKFVRWEDENHNLITFPHRIVSNVTINAIFTNEINLHFDTNGGNPIDDQKIIINEDINYLPTPTHSSGIFLGWFYDSNGVDTELRTPFKNIFLDDVTLVAHWRLTSMDYDYEALPDGNIKLLSYKGSDTDVIVPSIINGQNVTILGSSVFKNNKDIRTVTLSNTINTLEDEAFLNCTSLLTIDFNNSILNYGERCLIGCTNLSKICIANNVNLIQLFEYNNSNIPVTFENIKLNPNFENKIEVADGLTKMLFHNMGTNLFNFTFHDSFKNINGFENCQNIKSVSINEGAINIDTRAFSNCGNLTQVRISSTVTNIGDRAFRSNVKLTDLNIPNSVTNIGEEAFDGCSRLQSLDIPNSVKTIGNGAFSACTSLYAVKLPNSIEVISESLFEYTNNLAAVTIPPSVKTIKRYAFTHCIDLASVVLPNTVSSIEESAFSDCNSLFDVYYSGTAKEFNSIVVNDYNQVLNTAHIHYQSQVNEIAKYIDDNFIYIKTNQNEIKILDCINKEIQSIDFTTYFNGANVTSIARESFSSCDNLRSVILPDTLVFLGKMAFRFCYQISEIIIPASVEIIGNGAFSQCNNLYDIYCRVESKPAGWDEYWNASAHGAVHWGYKGN